jgi:hypothetical protein
VLRRFKSYIEKVFDFSAMVTGLEDTRRGASIGTESIWLSGWLMFVCRLDSLNALEIELQQSGKMNRFVGPRKASADTIGRTYGLLELAGPREMLACIALQLKRNKIFEPWRRENLICVAFDGHELFSSRHRHCDGCLERQVKQGDGSVTEWYHRIVACHVVDSPITIPLDIEPVLPGEDEVAAAVRLFDRLRERLPRYFDVVTVDALYAQAPFIRKVKDAGKHIVVVLKDKRRELLQDADGLFATQSPQSARFEDRECQLWDEEGFRSWDALNIPLRVVRSFESRRERKRIKGEWEEKVVEGDWWWATTLPKQQASTATVWHFGHGRWDIEDQAFNDMVTNWNMNHPWKHDPTAILAFLLTLLVAFVLVQCFFHRNLKPSRRRGRTLISVRLEFYSDLAAERYKPP